MRRCEEAWSVSCVVCGSLWIDGWVVFVWQEIGAVSVPGSVCTIEGGSWQKMKICNCACATACCPHRLFGFNSNFINMSTSGERQWCVEYTCCPMI